MRRLLLGQATRDSALFRQLTSPEIGSGQMRRAKSSSDERTLAQMLLSVALVGGVPNSPGRRSRGEPLAKECRSPPRRKLTLAAASL
jgi:hypothetical protein